MAKSATSGQGRPKGIPNKATAAKAKAIAESGLTPLDFMLQVLRNEELDMAVRLDASKGAAPYVHPKLAQVQLTGKDDGPLQVELVDYSKLHKSG